MRRLPLLLLVGCSEAGSAGPMPELTLVVRQGDGTLLLTRVFETYEVALASEPLVVHVLEGSNARDVEVDIGFCRQFPCTGHLEHEQLVLTADPTFPTPVFGFSCAGVAGSYAAGFDETRIGACAR
jgi:hypothetical protein